MTDCLFYDLKDSRWWFIKKGTQEEIDDHVKKYLQYDKSVLKISKHFIDDQIEEDRVVKDADMKVILEKISDKEANVKLILEKLESKERGRCFAEYYRKWEEDLIVLNLNKMLIV